MGKTKVFKTLIPATFLSAYLAIAGCGGGDGGGPPEPKNGKPVIESVSGQQTLFQTDDVSYAISASDPDGDLLSYKVRADGQEFNGTTFYGIRPGFQTIEVEANDGALADTTSIDGKILRDTYGQYNFNNFYTNPADIPGINVRAMDVNTLLSELDKPAYPSTLENEIRSYLADVGQINFGDVYYVDDNDTIIFDEKNLSSEWANIAGDVYNSLGISPADMDIITNLYDN